MKNGYILGHESRNITSSLVKQTQYSAMYILQPFTNIWRNVAAFKTWHWGFPGGAVVENPPANAGDTGSSPALGRSHMPRSSWAREPQLLSLRVWSLCSATREARASRWRVAPACHNWRRPSRGNEDPTQPKSINQSINQTYASDSRSSLKKQTNKQTNKKKKHGTMTPLTTKVKG